MDELQYLEVSLVEHCNLNCAGCSHFSPLAAPEQVDHAVLKRDFVRLAELFDGRIKRLRLMGGEPLLHTQICRILQMTREVFPASEIHLVTNGLFLPNMDDRFFQTCIDSQIHIRVTKYPLNGRYDRGLEVLNRTGAEFSFAANSDHSEKCFHYLSLDARGGHDAQANFTHLCTCSTCTNLADGKIYLCPVRACIRHFTTYFHKSFPLSEMDSLNIFKANLTAKDVLDFISKPCPFCECCDCEHITYGHRWKTSSREIGEWTRAKNI